MWPSSDRVLRFIAGVMLSGIVITPGGQFTALSQSSAEGRDAEILFAERLDASSAVTMLQSAGASVLELRHTYRSAEIEWTGFLVSSVTTPSEWATTLKREHDASVLDMLDQLERLAAAGGTAEFDAKIRSLRTAKSAFASAPVVFGARIQLRSQTAETSLRADRRVQSVKVRPLTARRPGGSGSKLARPLESHIARSQWVPDAMYLHVQPSSTAGQRYSQVLVKWNSGRSLYFGDGGGYRGAYEADMYLSGSGGTYLGRGEYGARIPNVYASTDFPGSGLWAPYLDTRFDDPSDRWSYTIGTPSAAQFTTGRWYNTYIRVANGDASTDTAIAPPQLGNCYDPDAAGCGTWQVFSHDTCPYPWPPQIAVPANSWYWTRTGGGSGQAACN